MVGLALLMVLWGTSYYCWRQLLTAFNEHRRNVALACSLLYLATVPALVCRQTENLTMALAIAVGMLILLVFGLRRHIERQLPIVFPPFSMTFAAKIIAVLTSVLVFWTLYQGYFWDENAAHFGVSSVLARGVSPPEHPLFPGQVFRYHYGFNVLVGQVMALSGCSVAIAIDIVGAVCFIALLVSAISAGYQLGGSKAASLAIVLLPLAGGTLQHLLFSDFGVLEWHWDLMPKSWYQNIPPPVISNFFQHPQGLAMGTALGVIQLFDDSNSNIKRYAPER